MLEPRNGHGRQALSWSLRRPRTNTISPPPYPSEFCHYYYHKDESSIQKYVHSFLYYLFYFLHVCYLLLVINNFLGSMDVDFSLILAPPSSTMSALQGGIVLGPTELTHWHQPWQTCNAAHLAYDCLPATAWQSIAWNVDFQPTKIGNIRHLQVQATPIFAPFVPRPSLQSSPQQSH